MTRATLREGAWWVAIAAAAVINLASFGKGSSATETETLTAAECSERGGERVARPSCPRGRLAIGTLESHAGTCCK